MREKCRSLSVIFKKNWKLNAHPPKWGYYSSTFTCCVNVELREEYSLLPWIGRWKARKKFPGCTNPPKTDGVLLPLFFALIRLYVAPENTSAVIMKRIRPNTVAIPETVRILDPGISIAAPVI